MAESRATRADAAAAGGAVAATRAKPSPSAPESFASRSGDSAFRPLELSAPASERGGASSSSRSLFGFVFIVLVLVLVLGRIDRRSFARRFASANERKGRPEEVRRTFRGFSDR